MVIVPAKYFGAPMESIQMMCDSVELPGKSYGVTDYRTYGPIRKVPVSENYQDLNMSFICTGKMLERTYFGYWQSLVADPWSEHYNYYDTYVGDMFIIELDNRQMPNYAVHLTEAWPIQMMPFALSYADVDNYQRLAVQIAYRHWYHIPLPTTATDLVNVGLPVVSRFIETAIQEYLNSMGLPGTRITDVFNNITSHINL
jgi:hypothetical protein